MKHELPDYVLRAIKSGPVPVLRDWRRLKPSQLTRAERVMAYAERYLRVPNGMLVGSKIRLDVFQQAFIYAVFDNKKITRRAYLSIARKNGKTALIAIILLAFLCGPEAVQNAELCSGALSRDQAATVFKYARQMAEASPEIAPLVKVVPSSKILVGLPLNVTYRALSADGKTNHGGNYMLAILDESGQVRGAQDDFIDAVLTSQGSHKNPLLIVISTQASSDQDWFSIQLDHAEKAGNDSTVSHLYTADPELSLDDPVGWQQANPAMGLFFNKQELVDGSREAVDMPSTSNTFEWLHLNRRISTSAPFVSRLVWSACGATPQDFDYNTPVYGGLDLSSRTDLTALELIGKINGVWQVRSYFWTPELGLKDRAKKDRAPYDLWHKQGFLRATPGKTVDYEHVAADILEIISGYNVQKIGYDRWRIDVLKKEFERLESDPPLIPVGQGDKDMTPALDFLEGELLNARVAHGNHPVLTMCAANAVVSSRSGSARKLDKAKATGRIDGMVALAMAFFAAQGEEVSDDAEFDEFINRPLVVNA